MYVLTIHGVGVGVLVVVVVAVLVVVVVVVVFVVVVVAILLLLVVAVVVLVAAVVSKRCTHNVTLKLVTINNYHNKGHHNWTHETYPGCSIIFGTDQIFFTRRALQAGKGLNKTVSDSRFLKRFFINFTQHS
jgi:hypothetical protein